MRRQTNKSALDRLFQSDGVAEVRRDPFDVQRDRLSSTTRPEQKSKLRQPDVIPRRLKPTENRRDQLSRVNSHHLPPPSSDEENFLRQSDNFSRSARMSKSTGDRVDRHNPKTDRSSDRRMPNPSNISPENYRRSSRRDLPQPSMSSSLNHNDKRLKEEDQRWKSALSSDYDSDHHRHSNNHTSTVHRQNGHTRQNEKKQVKPTSHGYSSDDLPERYKPQSTVSNNYQTDESDKEIVVVAEPKEKEEVCVNPEKPKPKKKQLYRRPLINQQFYDAEMVRAAVYKEWMEKKKSQLKQRKEEVDKTKETEAQKIKEKQDKKKEAEMMFEAWQREKNQVLREKQHEKRRHEKQQLIQTKEDNEAKLHEAAKVFRSWKREKDEILQHKIRRDKRKEREKQEIEAEATEAKQMEANRMFQAWKKIKDKEIKAALKRFREQYRDSQTEDSDTQLSERKAAAEANFREWMEKKKKAEFKQYMKEMTMKADDNEPAPWVPP